MIVITPELLKGLTTGWTTDYNRGFVGAESHYKAVAMVSKSSTAENVYPFLGQLPRMREWLGERRIKSLEVHGFTIKNRKFEDTIQVKRTDIEDDVAGVYNPLFEELGLEAGRQPDRLVFELLPQGFTAACYDGQNFFDVNHPSIGDDGLPAEVANFQDGAGPAWYLLDTSRAIRPFIYQDRTPYTLTRMDDEKNPFVFITDNYIYGVRGRSNAGFGLWELAYASKAELTVENYEAARTAMTALRGDEGSLLGVKPTVLLAPMALEGDARRVVKAQNLAGGESNVWADSVELICTHWLG